MLDKIINLLSNRFHKSRRKLMRNWKPKLITLGIAILLWIVMEYRAREANSEWNEEDIRIVVPE